MTEPVEETLRTTAFGEAFVSLMSRLNEEYTSLTRATVDKTELERIRWQVAVRFAQEAEELLARHPMPASVAEYVRHVVREGFEADFDPMDPSEGTSRPGASPPAPAG